MRTISYSQMSKFQECPHKWYQYYVEGFEDYKYPAFSFGKAVHKYIEESLKGVTYYFAADDFPKTKNLDEDIANAMMLGELALNSLTDIKDFGLNDLSLIDKNLIEYEFDIEVENGSFRGFIDLPFINKYGERIIVDWKTTSREYTEHDIKTSNQLTCYAFAYWKIFKSIPDKLYYVTLDKNTFEATLYQTSRTIDDLFALEKQIVDTIHAMDRMTNYKNENSCSGKFGKCPLYKKCWQNGISIIKNSVELDENECLNS